ncbi:MAG: tetratricopeptide repeat protein [Paraburkholderia sp.]|jgi:tetratricopeptide (TPR) repeat protein|nr:tetratricopeptide repeat protein [Paraburkholderia sp.]
MRLFSDQEIGLRSLNFTGRRQNIFSETCTSSFSNPTCRAKLFHELGNWFFERRKFPQSEHAYRSSLKNRPDWSETWNRLGVTVQHQNRGPEAEHIFRHVIASAPEFVAARNNLAMVLFNLARVDEAERMCLELLCSNPDYVLAHNSLGLIFLGTGRLADAEAAFRRALDRDPIAPEIHNNLGNALTQQGRNGEAVDAYRQALSVRPDFAIARMNLATELIRNGDFEQGWKLYEARFDVSAGGPPVPYPRWNGEPLAGKSLLVWPEQGYGDILQFCRYLPLLKANGVGRVSFASPPQLHRLLDNMQGVDAVYSLNGKDKILPHDYWCFIMSLPLLSGTTVETIPASVPYIRAPNELVRRWAARLPAERFKVGIAWAGNPRQHIPSWRAIDQRRSMPLRSLLPLLRMSGVTFVSLQAGERAQAQIDNLPPELRPLDLMQDVEDFADTAAIIECLDLVICVDTSIAHLAGALGKPVWILSRYDGCWRWFLDRDDSPWYPRMRLFRQRHHGDWDEVINRVTAALIDQITKQ